MRQTYLWAGCSQHTQSTAAKRAREGYLNAQRISDATPTFEEYSSYGPKRYTMTVMEEMRSRWIAVLLSVARLVRSDRMLSVVLGTGPSLVPDLGTN
jgi:hypothetical protein